MQILEILKRPVITEKSTSQQEKSIYTFEVAKSASKQQIKEAVELAFNVNVVRVNVITMPAKWRGPGRRRSQLSPWKKAVVTIKQGQKIEYFEGV
ncbi:MAG: 50S ribosomal protein L23 [Dehalococcoidia bacterium]|jgi:large subunit ribosomal protein L23